MKILKLYPGEDVNRVKYNYHVNYGLWDLIEGDSVLLENTNVNLNNYDVVLLPMFKRWNNINFLNKIKSSTIKTVLFDNDSCYRTFDHSFYNNIDLILYRDLDKNGNIPKTKSMWYPWSIDTTLYTPVYGNSSVSFNCSVCPKSYPLRHKISKIISNTSSSGAEYIKTLQNSGAGIHTDSELVPMVRAKALEMAACGTQIISNRTKKMDYFFPDDLILYFDDLDELKEIINNFEPNIEIQKELRNIVETKHDNKIRAMEVIEKIQEII